MKTQTHLPADDQSGRDLQRFLASTEGLASGCGPPPAGPHRGSWGTPAVHQNRRRSLGTPFGCGGRRPPLEDGSKHPDPPRKPQPVVAPCRDRAAGGAACTGLPPMVPLHAAVPTRRFGNIACGSRSCDLITGHRSGTASQPDDFHGMTRLAPAQALRAYVARGVMQRLCSVTACDTTQSH
jgi:hypothetical protein